MANYVKFNPDFEEFTSPPPKLIAADLPTLLAQKPGPPPKSLVREGVLLRRYSDFESMPLNVVDALISAYARVFDRECGNCGAVFTRNDRELNTSGPAAQRYPIIAMSNDGGNEIMSQQTISYGFKHGFPGAFLTDEGYLVMEILRVGEGGAALRTGEAPNIEMLGNHAGFCTSCGKVAFDLYPRKWAPENYTYTSFDDEGDSDWDSNDDDGEGEYDEDDDGPATF